MYHIGLFKFSTSEHHILSNYNNNIIYSSCSISKYRFLMMIFNHIVVIGRNFQRIVFVQIKKQHGFTGLKAAVASNHDK